MMSLFVIKDHARSKIMPISVKTMLCTGTDSSVGVLKKKKKKNLLKKGSKVILITV